MVLPIIRYSEFLRSACDVPSKRTPSYRVTGWQTAAVIGGFDVLKGVFIFLKRAFLKLAFRPQPWNLELLKVSQGTLCDIWKFFPYQDSPPKTQSQICIFNKTENGFESQLPFRATYIRLVLVYPAE